jgi:hypothetical protein
MTKTKTYLITAFLLISFYSFGQDIDCSESVTSNRWMKNDTSELDQINEIFETDWELIFKRDKKHSEIHPSLGELFLSMQGESAINTDKNKLSGQLHQVLFNDVPDFGDSFYIDGIDYEFHFQVVKVTDCLLVINVLVHKGGYLKAGPRLIFKKK